MHVAGVLCSHLFASVKGLNGAVLGKSWGGFCEIETCMDEILQIQKKGVHVSSSLGIIQKQTPLWPPVSCFCCVPKKKKS